MTAIVKERRPRSAFVDFLAAELAAREGRWAAVARIAVGSTVAVAIAMVFQIPQPTYVAYIGFAISKDETHGTLRFALAGALAITLAVILTLGLCIIDTAEPALRLPLMALATFIAMFTARTFSLGPIAYLAGFVIVLLQSFVDDARSPESITRLVLWMWVVVLVPVAITVTLNLLWGQSAESLIKRAGEKILAELKSSLVAGDYHPRLADWRSRLLSLFETSRQSPGKSARAGQITPQALAAMLDALVILECIPRDVPEGLRRQMAEFALIDSHSVQTPQVLAFFDAVARYRAALLRPSHGPVAADQRPTAHRLFIPDAFSNPAHWQFALKTTLAVMASYAIYTLLDWPGLRTAIVTCFFVALGSLGETVHKLLLRISGAAIGGLIAALCIVFVLPHLTDIGQLCLLVGTVSLGAAWVATSTDRLAYAGMQIAFAFLLGILQGYVPASDLTVLRDRLVGIILGNIVITLVFSSLWPTSAAIGLKAAMADALRGMATVLKGATNTEAARTHTVSALVRAEHFSSLSSFELRMLPTQIAARRALPTVAGINRLAAAVFVVASDSVHLAIDQNQTAVYAIWADRAAARLSGTAAVASLPPVTLPAVAMPSAVQPLDAEVRNVAAALP